MRVYKHVCIYIYIYIYVYGHGSDATRQSQIMTFFRLKLIRRSTWISRLPVNSSVPNTVICASSLHISRSLTMYVYKCEYINTYMTELLHLIRDPL